jgi:hypothetical protein
MSEKSVAKCDVLPAPKTEKRRDGEQLVSQFDQPKFDGEWLG